MDGMDIRLKDFDNYNPPRRRPWIIVVVILVVLALFLLLRGRSCSREDAEPEPERITIDDNSGPDIELPDAKAPMKTVEPITSSDAKEHLAQGQSQFEAGNLVGARDIYSAMLAQFPEVGVRNEAHRRIGAINMELVFNPYEMPEKATYVVKPNDSVGAIAIKHGTTQELVQKSNNIRDAHLIKVGDGLRVFNGKVSVSVSKKAHELVVYVNGDQFFKKYPIGIGEFNKTPIGDFAVDFKQKNPTWYRRQGPPVPAESEENILGTRWMAIKDPENLKGDRRGLGIHGTRDETTIGKSLSAGCIRMRNADVEELYALLPEGTVVSIRE